MTDPHAETKQAAEELGNEFTKVLMDVDVSADDLTKRVKNLLCELHELTVGKVDYAGHVARKHFINEILSNLEGVG